MRVFIGPHEIAGYYGNLASCLRQSGVNCDFVEFIPHSFKYSESEPSHFLVRWARYCNKKRGKTGRGLFVRVLYALPGEVLQLLYFPVALATYDTFIFGFGRSLLPLNADLPLLKLLRKRVVINMGHGSELRPPYIDGGYQSPDGRVQPTPTLLAKVAVHHKKKIRFIEKYSDVLIGAPFSSSQFSVRPFVNWFALGLPAGVRLNEIGEDKGFEAKEACATQLSSKRKFRILHSPSHPALKGTEKIRRAIHVLRQKGFEIDYVELTGRPNSEVITAIQRCDIVVDQVYSDTPMAGFAMEAAYFGKPVVVGGYGLAELRRHVREDMWPPSVTCLPDDIDKAIEALLNCPEKMREVGRLAQVFLQNKWSSVEVSQRFRCLIENRIPADWFVKQETINYVYGVGQPLEVTRAHIRGVVEQFGVAGLQLSDRPELELACLKLLESEGM